MTPASIFWQSDASGPPPWALDRSECEAARARPGCSWCSPALAWFVNASGALQERSDETAAAFVGFIAGANVPTPNPPGSIICGIIGAALARPIASIPIYYWRRQIMLEEERIKTVAGGRTGGPRLRPTR
jgi:hypothetical protein